MSDNVNHPAHYTGFSNGAEVIDITENLSFNLGNVVKYVARAGRKTEDPLEDLKKAQFYLGREIGRLTPTETLRAWTLSDISKLREQFWNSREPKWTVTISEPLPEGLSYDEIAIWRDKEGCLWRWSDKTWFYFDKGDNEWISVEGPPSNIYAPFREVDLWRNG